MILHLSFTDGTSRADVHYDDEARKGHTPTPELVEDVLRRMEPTLLRMWTGKSPDRVALPEDLTDE